MPRTAVPAPQWHLDEIEFLTAGSGRWIASNAEYQSENEPMEAYVLEWEEGYADSMTGRLYGIIDGSPVGDSWRFRQSWHPGDGEAQLQQWGFGGVYGVGAMWREDDKMKMAQYFYGPDGSVSLNGHISYNPDADTHITESYTINDGVWTLNRRYVWKRDDRV